MLAADSHGEGDRAERPPGTGLLKWGVRKYTAEGFSRHTAGLGKDWALDVEARLTRESSRESERKREGENKRPTERSRNYFQTQAGLSPPKTDEVCHLEPPQAGCFSTALEVLPQKAWERPLTSAGRKK